MLMTVDEFKRSFGFGGGSCSFTDCAVRDKNKFVFVASAVLSDEYIEWAEENGSDLDYRPKLVATFFKDRSLGKQWEWLSLQQWGIVQIGTALNPLNQSITVEQYSRIPSLDNRVFVTGSGLAYEDKVIGPIGEDVNGFLRGAVTRLKTLDGYLYACGGGRSFAKRIAKEQWKPITQDIPKMTGEDIGGKSGFNDFDGFNEQDIYAAGGNGDVWHFDGNRWTPIAFPTNEPLQSVCCGGDGNVYISGYEGLTFMGRGERWKQIHCGGISLGFRDMVWYEDRVWCTSDYGVWTIHNGQVERARLPDDIGSCAGHLYTGDGVLLLAGLGGAAFKENGQWHSIISFPVMERLLELDQTNSAP